MAPPVVRPRDTLLERLMKTKVVSEGSSSLILRKTCGEKRCYGSSLHAVTDGKSNLRMREGSDVRECWASSIRNAKFAEHAHIQRHGVSPTCEPGANVASTMSTTCLPVSAPYCEDQQARNTRRVNKPVIGQMDKCTWHALCTVMGKMLI